MPAADGTPGPGNMAAPRLSIVTPTYNRRERLSRVLAALDAQTVPDETFEVVVVDDGSSDGTSEWLAKQRFRFTLRPIRQANGGPAKARNAGVLAAQGELVLFLDDDVVPAPELVREHLRSHEAEQSESLVVLGPMSSLPHYAQPWVAWEQAKVEKQYAAMSRGDYAPSFRQFWTGNASLAREPLVAAGLFNTELKRGEDIELGRRLADRGLKYRFNAGARGLHHAERSLDSWCHAHASYGELELRVFEDLGEGVGVKMLAENFARLHRATQWVLRRCLGHARREAALQASLKAYLQSPLAERAHKASAQVCSLLANLLYWRASRNKLGAREFDEVLERAHEIVTGKRPPQ